MDEDTIQAINFFTDSDNLDINITKSGDNSKKQLNIRKFFDGGGRHIRDKDKKRDIVLFNGGDAYFRLYGQIFKDQLKELAQLEGGKRFLKQVHELALLDTFSEKPFKIIISNNGGNRYNQEENQVELNFGDAIATTDEKNNVVKLFQVYPLIQGKLRSSDGEELVESGPGLSPFFMSTFHELDHYKDQKSRNKKVEKYFTDTGEQIQPSDRIVDIRRTLKEGTSQQEHRVIFDGDPDDTSELTLRLEAGEPLRYLYQDSTRTIYEPIKTVLRYATHFVKPEKQYQVASKLYNYLQNLTKVDQIQPDENINAASMKLRLASDRLFKNAFSNVNSNRNISDLMQRFIDARTSPKRVEKICRSMEKTSDRIINMSIFSTNSSKDAESVKDLKKLLKRRLELRLGRRNNELDILKPLRIPRGGKLPPLSPAAAFYKIAGIPTPGVQEMPIFSHLSSRSSKKRGLSPP
jgi:hypothetical protein